MFVSASGTYSSEDQLYRLVDLDALPDLHVMLIGCSGIDHWTVKKGFIQVPVIWN